MKAFFARKGQRPTSSQNPHAKDSAEERLKTKSRQARQDENLYYSPPPSSAASASATVQDIGAAPALSSATVRNKKVYRASSLGTLQGLLTAAKANGKQSNETLSSSHPFDPQNTPNAGRRGSLYSLLVSHTSGGQNDSASQLNGDSDLTSLRSNRTSYGQQAKRRLGSLKGIWSEKGPTESAITADEAKAATTSSTSNAQTRLERPARPSHGPSYPPSSYHYFDPASVKTKRKGASTPIPSSLPSGKTEEDVHPTVFVVSNSNKSSPRTSPAISSTDKFKNLHEGKDNVTATPRQNREDSVIDTDTLGNPKLVPANEPSDSAQTVLPRVDSTLSLSINSEAPAAQNVAEPENSAAVSDHQKHALPSDPHSEVAGLCEAEIPSPDTPRLGDTHRSDTTVSGDPTPTISQGQFENALGPTEIPLSDSLHRERRLPGLTLRKASRMDMREVEGTGSIPRPVSQMSSKWSPMGSILRRSSSNSKLAGSDSARSPRQDDQYASPLSSALHVPAMASGRSNGSGNSATLSSGALATKLNELAVSHADGLLSDEEYRLLRQDLFEQSTNFSPAANHSGFAEGESSAPASPLSGFSSYAAESDANVRGGAYSFVRPSVVELDEGAKVNSPRQRDRLVSTTSSSRASAQVRTKSLFRKASTKSNDVGYSEVKSLPRSTPSSPVKHLQRDLVSMPPPASLSRSNSHRSRNNGAPSWSSRSGVGDQRATSPTPCGSSLHSGSESLPASSNAGHPRSLRPSTIGRLLSSGASRSSNGEGREQGSRSRLTSTASTRQAELDQEVSRARMSRTINQSLVSRAGSNASDSHADARTTTPKSRSGSSRSAALPASPYEDENRERRERAYSLSKPRRSQEPTTELLDDLASRGSGFDAADWRYSEKRLADIEAEIRVVEAEGQRVLEAFEGLEEGVLRKAGPASEHDLLQSSWLEPKANLTQAATGLKNKLDKRKTGKDVAGGAGATVRSRWRSPQVETALQTTENPPEQGRNHDTPALAELQKIRSRRSDVAKRYDERLAFLQSKARSAKIREKLAKS